MTDPGGPTSHTCVSLCGKTKEQIWVKHTRILGLWTTLWEVKNDFNSRRVRVHRSPFSDVRSPVRPRQSKLMGTHQPKWLKPPRTGPDVLSVSPGSQTSSGPPREAEDGVTLRVQRSVRLTRRRESPGNVSSLNPSRGVVPLLSERGWFGDGLR